MPLDKKQLRGLVDRVLKELDLYSPVASDLILGTIAQESRMGTYIRQLRGPALGIIQMEPATEEDIWENFIKWKPEYREKIFKLTGASAPNLLKLEGDLIYQIIMCRLHYLRVPEALPRGTPSSLARYWKKYYNTPLGRGTTGEFMCNYSKYVSN